MHPKEANRSHIGTGRMANVALKNCRIIVDENFDQNQAVQKMINSSEYFPMVLYPGATALNISKEKITLDFFQNKKPLLFILDGTWSCAKSMMRDSKTLHSLPRLSFETKIESKFAIRQQPAKFCLSTIESIYQVLSILEEQKLEKLGAKKEILLKSLQNLVAFQIKCASDPKMQHYGRRFRPYSKPEERSPSKKWQDRKVCFERLKSN